MGNDVCLECGAEAVNYGNSLHVWHIDYACGGSIIGPICDDGWEVHKECPNKGLTIKKE